MKFKNFLVVAFFLISSNALADAPNGYYDDAIGKTGHELKAALHEIIDDQKVYPYTSPNNEDWHDGLHIDVWEALLYTDSACSDNESPCSKVQLLYLDESRDMIQANRGSGNHDSWDREHVWPKSRGFKKKYQDGYTDLHHLRPADRNLNGTHSNFGYDEGGKIVMDKKCDGTLVKTEAKIDRKNQSYEPPDRAKGQVARMLFYMAIRYEVGDDQGNERMPDLYLIDDNKKTKEPLIGDLCTLLMWNNKFGPTDFERRRNDRIMELQGNRNPFIDEPGFSNLIWQSQCND